MLINRPRCKVSLLWPSTSCRPPLGLPCHDQDEAAPYALFRATGTNQGSPLCQSLVEDTRNSIHPVYQHNPSRTTTKSQSKTHALATQSPPQPEHAVIAQSRSVDSQQSHCLVLHNALLTGSALMNRPCCYRKGHAGFAHGVNRPCSPMMLLQHPFLHTLRVLCMQYMACRAYAGPHLLKHSNSKPAGPPC